MSRLVCLALLVLVAAVAIAAAPHEDFSREHVVEVAEECKTESGATEEDVEHVMKHEPPASHEGKCLRSCMMKKFDIMDDAGKLSKEHALDLVKAMTKDDAEKEAAATAIVDKCEETEVSEDHCEAAVAYMDCIVEQMHEHGLSLAEH